MLSFFSCHLWAVQFLLKEKYHLLCKSMCFASCIFGSLLNHHFTTFRLHHFSELSPVFIFHPLISPNTPQKQIHIKGQLDFWQIHFAENKQCCYLFSFFTSKVQPREKKERKKSPLVLLSLQKGEYSKQDQFSQACNLLFDNGRIFQCTGPAQADMWWLSK